MPDPRLIKQIVRNQYERYPFPPFSGLEVMRWHSVFKDLFQRLQVSPAGLSAVDVGCGTGNTSCSLSLLGMRVVSIDVSARSVRQARRNSKVLGLDIDFIVSDLFASCIRTEFDLVVCLGVLHHTEDAPKGFGIVTGLAKRGGLVVVGLYSKFSLKHRLIDLLVRNRFCDIEERLRFVLRHRRFFGFISPQIRSVLLAGRPREVIVDEFCHAHRTYASLEDAKTWMKVQGVRYLGMLSRSSKYSLQNLIARFLYFYAVGTRA